MLCETRRIVSHRENFVAFQCTQSTRSEDEVPTESTRSETMHVLIHRENFWLFQCNICIFFVNGQCDKIIKGIVILEI